MIAYITESVESARFVRLSDKKKLESLLQTVSSDKKSRKNMLKFADDLFKFPVENYQPSAVFFKKRDEEHGFVDILLCGIRPLARDVYTATCSSWLVSPGGVIVYKRGRDIEKRNIKDPDELMKDFRKVEAWVRASRSSDQIFNKI